jgi:hypothetical protein
VVIAEDLLNSATADADRSDVAPISNSTRHSGVSLRSALSLSSVMSCAVACAVGFSAVSLLVGCTPQAPTAVSPTTVSPTTVSPTTVSPAPAGAQPDVVPFETTAPASPDGAADVDEVGFEDSEAVVVETPFEVPAESPAESPPAETPAEPAPVPATQPAPQPTPQPAPAQQPPSGPTTLSPFAIPFQTTIPYVAESGATPVGVSQVEVNGVTMAVPTGWIILATPDDVVRTTQLAEGIRIDLYAKMQSDPSRKFLVSDWAPQDPASTVVEISARANNGLTSQQAVDRFVHPANVPPGFRVGPRGPLSWLGVQGQAGSLIGTGGIEHHVLAAGLADGSLVVLQVNGRDAGKLLALFAKGTSIAPRPAVTPAAAIAPAAN